MILKVSRKVIFHGVNYVFWSWTQLNKETLFSSYINNVAQPLGQWNITSRGLNVVRFLCVCDSRTQSTVSGAVLILLFILSEETLSPAEVCGSSRTGACAGDYPTPVVTAYCQTLLQLHQTRMFRFATQISAFSSTSDLKAYCHYEILYFLGAFAKLRKATITFACLSVRPHGAARPPVDEFS